MGTNHAVPISDGLFMIAGPGGWGRHPHTLKMSEYEIILHVAWIIYMVAI